MVKGYSLNAHSDTEAPINLAPVEPAAWDSKKIWQARQGSDQGEEHETTYDIRGPYDRDRSRLIHTPAFRRLQAKTQVLDIAEGDYHRTRLTHTMEVAQIGRGLVQRLEENCKGDPRKAFLPSYDLIEVIAFAHDLGHPPFGHNGEVALNYMMREHGGFEGNGQSLRLVTWGERRIGGSTEFKGISLTRRTLLGVLKYPRSYFDARRKTLPPAAPNFRLVNQETWKPPKCFYDSEQGVVDWVLKPLSPEDRALFGEWKAAPTETAHGKTAHKSLDSSLLELADDVAYATHDLEDGVALGFIRQGDWETALDPGSAEDKEAKARVEEALKGWADWAAQPGHRAPTLAEIGGLLFKGGAWRRKAASHLIGAFIHSVELTEVAGFDCPLLRYRAVLPKGLDALLKILQKLAYQKVIRSADLQTLEFRGRNMIMEMFEALVSDPVPLLKDTQRKQFDEAASEAEQMRVICDFVAGMTDPYATRFYERLFVPRSGSAFDKL
jgi:dGTPase